MYIMKDLLKNKKLMFVIICISLVLANSPDANMKSSSSVAIASQTTPGLARNGPPNKDSPSEQKPTNESNDDVSNLEFQRLFNISRSFHKIPVNSYLLQDQACPICFDIWTNMGPHRLSSLPCGHLFGRR